MSCRLYAPAPVPDTFTVPPTVRLPATAREPITKVPAVMEERSLDSTLKLPEAEATERVALLFGMRETVPEPASMPLPPPALISTSAAVIVIAAFVDSTMFAMLTKPVPFVVMVTPVMPVARADNETLPEPDVV